MQKIIILDFGGQYAHLIGSRIRSLGAYTEIVSADHQDWSAEFLEGVAGIILSGGPQSVYDQGSIKPDPAVYRCGLPILGICYGLQIMVHQLGGVVSKTDVQEYGPAKLELLPEQDFLAADMNGSQVWMSHRDQVKKLPEGFVLAAKTRDCEFTAIVHPDKKMWGVQFHPEVVHTSKGLELLKQFVALCGLSGTWTLQQFIDQEMDAIKAQVESRQGSRVFLLVSGGVDSTVAYALLGKAILHENIYPLLVDTGYMRAGEVEQVVASLAAAGLPLNVFDAKDMYEQALTDIYEPEAKRMVIGRLFVDIQKQVAATLHLDSGGWLLGQGTIYPDTIESAGTKHAALIKTHHNRVPEIEALIAAGQVVEPLKQLYKDEVRRVGRLLGLPDALIDRQPFPGPGLGVRILNVDPQKVAGDVKLAQTLVQKVPQLAASEYQSATAISVMPLQSVGVKGDARSYEHCAVLHIADLKSNSDYVALGEWGVNVVNQAPGINRAALCLDFDLEQNASFNTEWDMFGCWADQNRAGKLRQADKIVNDFQAKHDLLKEIWQFPVVLIPVFRGSNDNAKNAKVNESDVDHRQKWESLVLRPVQSQEAMTVNFYEMDHGLLKELVFELKQLPWVDSVLYDITHKPPGTIEWE